MDPMTNPTDEREPVVEMTEEPDLDPTQEYREDAGVVAALDVGQLRDPSVLAVVQCWVSSAWTRDGEPVSADRVVLARQAMPLPPERPKVWRGGQWVRQRWPEDVNDRDL